MFRSSGRLFECLEILAVANPSASKMCTLRLGVCVSIGLCLIDSRKLFYGLWRINTWFFIESRLTRLSYKCLYHFERLLVDSRGIQPPNHEAMYHLLRAIRWTPLDFYLKSIFKTHWKACLRHKFPKTIQNEIFYHLNIAYLGCIVTDFGNFLMCRLPTNERLFGICNCL